MIFTNLAEDYIKNLTFVSQLRTLLWKDFRLEFRQKVLTATVFLFVVSACFTIYQVFIAGRARVNPLVWNAVFWLVVLFSSFQVVSRSFTKELDQQYWYYYFQVKAELLILSKLIYHIFILNISALMAWLFLSLLFGNPVQDGIMFFCVIELGCIGIASALTLISAISAKAGKNATLLPVLGFPVLIPTLMLVIRLSVTSLDALGWDMAWKNIWTLLGLDFIMIALSFILFPYLWRQ